MDETYYRQLLRQMQQEFTRAVEALEKQIATLTRHNTLLTNELTQMKHQRQNEGPRTQQNVVRISSLPQGHDTMATQVLDVSRNQQPCRAQEEALELEIAALKCLLQQETKYWRKYEATSQQDRAQLIQQVTEVKAELGQASDENQMLKHEIKVLQNRVETAIATSKSFEQRLVVVLQEKQQQVEELEVQLNRYRTKLHEKRVQKKYLTEALVRLQERQQTTPLTSEIECVTVRKRNEKPATTEQHAPKQRLQQDELRLPEDIDTRTHGTLSKKSRRRGSLSRTSRSPTSSSPESLPRSARAAPYKRPPSVATTTPTASDGNSFNSSGSLRSMRSLRNVTGRRIGSRNSSDSDNIDVSPRTIAAHRQGTNPTGRLERELTGLRRKLDSCMADTAARW